MALTLNQLLQPQTQSQLTSLLIGALQGLGLIVAANASGGAPAGTGSLSLSGTPTLPASLASPASCIIKVTSSGELGAAQVQVSIDGGSTYAAAVTVPTSGIVAVTGTQGATGVSATLAAGPTGGGTSFVSGDTYSFSLSTPNFPVTSWQAGSVPRTIVGIEAQALASLSSIVSAIAAGGLVSYATGSWLDLLAQNVYGLTRNLPVATVGLATLTDAAGLGPITIAAGQVTAVATNGQLYQNSTGGTLSNNGTLQLSWQALQPGTAGNVANGTLSTISTGLVAGVTINNPDPGSGTWVTTQGADPETDAALQQRCLNRWASLGIGATAAAYQLWAATATSNVTRSLVMADATVAGQVDVYVAGSSGGSGSADVTTVQNYINARVPLAVVANVQAATNVPITVGGTVYYYGAKTSLGAVQAAVAANLNTLFQNGPIGKDNTPSTYVYQTQIIEQIMLATGVRNVALTSPTGDTALTIGQVATLTNSLSLVAV